MPARRQFLIVLITAASAFAGVVPPANADATEPVVLVVGDSISAGYGLPPDTGWVSLLAIRMREQGYRERVINASITGDTTAGGRARLPTLIAQHKPSTVVVELGGNDGLRGGNLTATRDNLDAMVTLAQRAGAKVLLVGMRLPPNYGPAYTRTFDELFGAVASARKVPLVPFLFAGFGDGAEWFQPDRIHPTVAAQPKLLDNVWPQLTPLLRKR